MPEGPPPELDAGSVRPEPEPVAAPLRRGSAQKNGSVSGPLNDGGAGASRESLDSTPAGVRARVLRRLQRPHSLADGPGLPHLGDLLMSRAYSVDADNAREPFLGAHVSSRNRSMKELKRGGRQETNSNGALPAERRAPWRIVSLADCLLRRKLSRPAPPADALNIIANPMHAELPDDEPHAAHPV